MRIACYGAVVAGCVVLLTLVALLGISAMPGATEIKIEGTLADSDVEVLVRNHKKTCRAEAWQYFRQAVVKMNGSELLQSGAFLLPHRVVEIKVRPDGRVFVGVTYDKLSLGYSVSGTYRKVGNDWGIW